MTTHFRRRFRLQLRIALACCFGALSHQVMALHIPDQRRIEGTYGKLPLVFEPNLGQTSGPAKFLVRCRNYIAFLQPDRLTFALHTRHNSQGPLSPQAVSIRFEGANKDASMRGTKILPGHSNYLIGQDPRHWHINIPQYEQVSVREVYPGIALELHGNPIGLEYDLVLSAGADSSRIHLRVDGAQQIEVNERGDLIFEVPGGQLVQTRPYAYQVKQGVRYPVIARYRILENRTVTFDLGSYDKHTPLTIDPSFTYSTEFGGGYTDSAFGIAVDESGSAYVTGATLSADFPTVQAIKSLKTDGSFENDAFVTKLNPSGNSIVYSTFMGGGGSDAARSIAVDASGVYISGNTTSTDYPLANALQSSPASGFVTKISAAGTSLAFSTYFEGGNALAIDASSAVYVQGGITGSNAFFSKIDPTGTSIEFATQFADATTLIKAIAIDATTHDIVVTGTTKYATLATLNAFQTTRVGTSSATGFVTKFSSTGTGLIYSTYLGGSVDDRPTSVALDSDGTAYVTGNTSSYDFPVTSGALEPALQPGNSCFVTEFGTNGQFLVSTFLGGHFKAECNAIAVDTSRKVFVGGTGQFNYPVLGSIELNDHTQQAAFVTKLKPDLSSMVYSTLVGTNSQGQAIALDASGNAYLASNAVWPGTFPIVNSTTFGPLGNDEEIGVSKIVDDTTCASVNVSPTNFLFDVFGGAGSITVTAPSGCSWNVVGNATANPATSVPDTQSPFPVFTGNGAVDFSVNSTALNQPTATGYFVVAGQRVTFTQTGLGSLTPCLNVSAGHSGNFAQGQQNGTFTLIVSNAQGAVSTNGTVTVTATLPTGITLTSMAGTGWTCPGTASNNCSRNGALNGGSSFPPIMVTVALAANASSPQLSQFTVTGGGSPSASATDLAAVTVTRTSISDISPGAGNGSTQSFTFTFEDPNGYTDLTVVDVLINNVLDGSGACYIAFAPASATSGSLYLVDDAGDGGYAGGSPISLPSSATLQNSQCTISGTGSSVSASGNTLTLTLAVTFASGFGGNKVVYTAARSNSQNSGWQAMGTWRAPGPVPPGPAVAGMSPARSGSVSQAYTFTFNDTNGWQDIGVANVLINGAIDGRSACYVAFVPSGSNSGSVFLVDDAGEAGGPYSGMVLPGSGTVQNSQCAIDGTRSSIVGSGNTLTVTLAMTFSQAFAGNQVFFLAARNNSSNSNWQAVGSVTIP